MTSAAERGTPCWQFISAIDAAPVEGFPGSPTERFSPAFAWAAPQLLAPQSWPGSGAGSKGEGVSWESTRQREWVQQLDAQTGHGHVTSPRLSPRLNRVRTFSDGDGGPAAGLSSGMVFGGELCKAKGQARISIVAFVGEKAWQRAHLA
jgi:hypothetical protein